MKKILAMLVLITFSLGGLEIQVDADHSITSFAQTIDQTTNRVFQFTVPGGFQCLQETGWESQPQLEFIPNDEYGFNWSKIATISELPAKHFTANKVTAMLRKNIKSDTPKVILKDLVEHDDDLTFSALTIAYDLGGKHEILGARFYSNKDNCIGVQYTIRPLKRQTDEQSAKEIDQFFEQHVRLINMEKISKELLKVDQPV